MNPEPESACYLIPVSFTSRPTCQSIPTSATSNLVSWLNVVHRFIGKIPQNRPFWGIQAYKPYRAMLIRYIGRPNKDLNVIYNNLIRMDKRLSGYSLMSLVILLIKNLLGYVALQLVPFEVQHFLVCHIAITRQVSKQCQ